MTEFEYKSKMQEMTWERSIFETKKRQHGYTTEEKNAYYMGVGAGLCGAPSNRIGKTLNTMPKNVRFSFENGWEKGIFYRGIYPNSKPAYFSDKRLKRKNKKR